MLKRMIALCLVIAMLVPLSSAVAADELSSGIQAEEQELVIIHDPEKNSRIEALLALRGELELDYEANADAIASVDAQLQQLGVEEVSNAEIMGKLGMVAPAIEIPSTDYVRWTSRRLVVTYHGQHYELQIYEAIASATDSPLLDETTHIVKHKQNVQVAVDAALGVVAAHAWQGVVDKICDVEELIYGISYIELAQLSNNIATAVEQAMSTSESIDNVKGLGYATIATHMRYIFVKPYQTPDEGNQVLSYIGNTVSYTITTITHIWSFTETEASAEHFTAEISGTTYSPYFDDFSEAAKNHYNYRYGGITDFNDRYYLTSMTFDFFGEVFTHNIKNIWIDSDLI